MEEDQVEDVWAKTPFHATYFLYICYITLYYIFSFPFQFPGIPWNDSL